jgi:hypothetical protein
MLRVMDGEGEVALEAGMAHAVPTTQLCCFSGR